MRMNYTCGPHFRIVDSLQRRARLWPSPSFKEANRKCEREHSGPHCLRKLNESQRFDPMPTRPSSPRSTRPQTTTNGVFWYLSRDPKTRIAAGAPRKSSPREERFSRSDTWRKVIGIRLFNASLKGPVWVTWTRTEPRLCGHWRRAEFAAQCGSGGASRGLPTSSPAQPPKENPVPAVGRPDGITLLGLTYVGFVYIRPNRDFWMGPICETWATVRAVSTHATSSWSPAVKCDFESGPSSDSRRMAVGLTVAHWKGFTEFMVHIGRRKLGDGWCNGRVPSPNYRSNPYYSNVTARASNNENTTIFLIWSEEGLWGRAVIHVATEPDA